jgi:hypothetical protein
MEIMTTKIKPNSFIYNKDQVQLLSRCLKSNRFKLSHGLSTFFSHESFKEKNLTTFEFIQWLGKAEDIEMIANCDLRGTLIDSCVLEALS